jgi:hypothetical protein
MFTEPENCVHGSLENMLLTASDKIGLRNQRAENRMCVY